MLYIHIPCHPGNECCTSIIRVTLVTNVSQLYRSDDDYVVLCAAESLEADMRSGDKTAVPGDLATVCRLCKLRYSDEDTMVHLVSALNLLLVRREDDEWVTELIEEEIVKELIKKLTSPSPAHKPTADLIATVGANKRE